MSIEYEPRGCRVPKFQFEITIEQRRALDSLNLPHGFRRVVFSAIVDEFIRLMKTQRGKIVLGAVATGQLTLLQALEMTKDDNDQTTSATAI